jgi:competence protein ComGC
MFRIAAVVWIMLAVTLAGISLLVIVTVPSLNQQAATLLPIACGAAAVVAMPLSYLVARRIAAATAS